MRCDEPGSSQQKEGGRSGLHVRQEQERRRETRGEGGRATDTKAHLMAPGAGACPRGHHLGLRCGVRSYFMLYAPILAVAGHGKALQSIRRE